MNAIDMAVVHSQSKEKFIENMKIRRFERVTGMAATYIHAGGAVGVLVSFDTDEKTAAAAEFKERCV